MLHIKRLSKKKQNKTKLRNLTKAVNDEVERGHTITLEHQGHIIEPEHQEHTITPEHQGLTITLEHQGHTITLEHQGHTITGKSVANAFTKGYNQTERDTKIPSSLKKEVRSEERD